MNFTKILVTGAAGFIGSNFVRASLEQWPDRKIVALDKLGYAGNTANFDGLSNAGNMEFVEGDVSDEDLMRSLVKDVDGIVHFAAESMVDRSVIDGRPFAMSNVVGTYTLYDAVRHHGSVSKILHISTPEVYGERMGDAAIENATFRPRNLYAATKAGGEMLAYAYQASFGLPIVFTRGSNAIGPRQHIEKVLPLWITRAIQGQSLTVYGDGGAVRDWIDVRDMNSANDLVLREAAPGEAYNIVSGDERSLKELAEGVLTRVGAPTSLIEYVGERPAHDHRYHMAIDKLSALGWSPQYSFEQTLDDTVSWYVENQDWWQPIQDSAEYQDYLATNLRAKVSR